MKPEKCYPALGKAKGISDKLDGSLHEPVKGEVLAFRLRPVGKALPVLRSM